MNVLALIGNVASEPELTYSASGKARCSFRLAVSRPGGADADFFTIVTWDRQAEVAAEYLDLGRRVGIEGRLHMAADGVEVVADRVQLLGARPSDSQGEIPGSAPREYADA